MKKEINVIPEDVSIRISDCTRKVLSIINLYSGEFYDWVEKNPGVELSCTIDYPLTNSCTFKVKGEFIDDIIMQVVDKYKKIYKEESKSTKISPDLIPGMLNRNTTNGKYGIWGHDLDDLSICGLQIDTSKNELLLDIES